MHRHCGVQTVQTVQTGPNGEKDPLAKKGPTRKKKQEKQLFLTKLTNPILRKKLIWPTRKKLNPGKAEMTGRSSPIELIAPIMLMALTT